MKNGRFIIDADGHVVEFLNNAQALRRHLSPRFRNYPLGGGGFKDRNVGGRDGVAKYGKNPSGPAEQLDDMDIEGIDIAVLYPTILLTVWRLKERDFALDLHRAYNDWLAEFCSYRPDRLKGVAALPTIDPAASAHELERAVAELGFVGGMAHTWNYNGHAGEASFDQLYGCAQQYDVPIGFHASGSEDVGRLDTFLAEHTLGHPHEQMTVAVQLVYAGVFEKHPRLRVGFLEGTAGWIPMLAERMDEEYEKHPEDAPLLTRKPSEYFTGGQTFFGVESGEWMLPTVIRYLGKDDNLMFSSDYPHWDGEFPNATRTLIERSDLTEDNKRKILGDNAKRFYAALARSPAAAGA